jgi:hypothetical protein
MGKTYLRTCLVGGCALLLGFSGLARAVSTSPLPPDPPDAVGMHIIGAVDVATCIQGLTDPLIPTVMGGAEL